MGHGHPEAWYYTSRAGRIAKKSKQNTTIKTIYQTFQNIAKSYGSERYIAVVRRGARSTVVTDDGLDDFRSLLKGADSITSFIPPRMRNISGRSIAELLVFENVMGGSASKTAKLALVFDSWGLERI